MPAGSRLTGLPPVITKNANVLILGSFPSRMSLESGEYYANPKNRFWAVMERLFGIPRGLPYRSRTRLLEKNRIALWDAVGSCRREGSADRSITDPVANDIAGLLASHPGIRLVACNGSASAGFVSRCTLPGTVTVLRLPSTSPAHAAMTLEEKIARWSVILENP